MKLSGKSIPSIRSSSETAPRGFLRRRRSENETLRAGSPSSPTKRRLVLQGDAPSSSPGRRQEGRCGCTRNLLCLAEDPSAPGENCGGRRSKGQGRPLRSGKRLPYDRLLVATGSSSRSWVPGRDLSSVSPLRKINDAEAIRRNLRSTRGPIVIVGGGLVGVKSLEALIERKGGRSPRHLLLTGSFPDARQTGVRFFSLCLRSERRPRHFHRT